MEKKYKALRTIGTIYKVLGIIAGVLTILSIIGFCATSIFGGAMFDMMNTSGYGVPGIFGGALGGVILSLGALIYGGGASVTLYALGEGVYLLIELEENTRATAVLLKKKLNE